MVVQTDWKPNHQLKWSLKTMVHHFLEMSSKQCTLHGDINYLKILKNKTMTDYEEKARDIVIKNAISKNH